jgi:exopolyphosphatase/guanosine-5'-triphosphate,3'-diphosphate pyrophosphatase
MKEHILASIDIGSNGARLLIKRFEEDDAGCVKVRKIMFIRVPLRLGKDVFSIGMISKERANMMMRMMKGFKQFMRMHDVETYRACATSAMRDAENGKKLLKSIEKETGIRLEIIEGKEEAQLLCNNLVEMTDSNEGNFAYVDVGGGSTEVSLIHDGALVESHSYNVGTLRWLAGGVAPETINSMKQELKDFALKYSKIKIIGSGGNINRYFKLVHNKDDAKELKVPELKQMYGLLKPLSLEERMNIYNLKEDRADVIIPAAEIFIAVARSLKCTIIMVPNISLADSIVDGLYKNIREKEKGR